MAAAEHGVRARCWGEKRRWGTIKTYARIRDEERTFMSPMKRHTGTYMYMTGDGERQIRRGLLLHLPLYQFIISHMASKKKE